MFDGFGAFGRVIQNSIETAMGRRRFSVGSDVNVQDVPYSEFASKMKQFCVPADPIWAERWVRMLSIQVLDREAIPAGLYRGLFLWARDHELAGDLAAIVSRVASDVWYEDDRPGDVARPFILHCDEMLVPIGEDRTTALTEICIHEKGGAAKTPYTALVDHCRARLADLGGRSKDEVWRELTEGLDRFKDSHPDLAIGTLYRLIKRR
jgi:hypothetical protein